MPRAATASNEEDDDQDGDDEQEGNDEHEEGEKGHQQLIEKIQAILEGINYNVVMVVDSSLLPTQPPAIKWLSVRHPEKVSLEWFIPRL